jgi:5-methylcytosine-specific restriction protein A
MPNRPPTHKPLVTHVTIHRPREARPSSHKRGYTRRWQAYRLWYLATHPLCATPDCHQPAKQVDHVKAVTGPDDPLFWEETNHQALCHSCHSRKTATEDRRR